MKRFVVEKRDKSGERQVFCHAQQLNAGDISLPLEDGALRSDLEAVIYYLRHDPSVDEMVTHHNGEEYLVRRKIK